MIQRNPTEQQKISEGISAINQAAQRGATLVHQILTFARQADISFKVMNIRELVLEIRSMLIETFPKIITIRENVKRDLPFINADHSQLHQVLLNLCVNARDAMPDGGEIAIEGIVIMGKTLKQQFPQQIIIAILRSVCLTRA